MSKIDYTLWPNTEGTLGQNKVQIPDGVTTQWPEGDALVGNFVYNKGKLVGFVDTKALINNTSKTSTINYDFVDIHLENIGEGDITFTLGERCKKFTVTYGSSDTGNSGDTVTFKYKGCTTVEEVKAVDPDYLTNDIVDGVWTEGLGDLENGYRMFIDCRNLTTFTSDLSSLTNGSSMFYDCDNLTAFSSDLRSLTYGSYMFYDCNALTSFSSDLSSLKNGYVMFLNCTNLTSFNSDLSSLTDGSLMFSGCKLDTASVQNIAATINTPTSEGTIHIGIGNSTPNEEEDAAFKQMSDKGWSVYVNGSSYGQESCCSCCASCCASLSTLDENGEETTETPIPYWAKPVPATEETAEFVDVDGNYYNVLGAQFIYVSDPETYGMFLNREDAIANMRLKRIGEEEIETA